MLGRQRSVLAVCGVAFLLSLLASSAAEAQEIKVKPGSGGTKVRPGGGTIKTGDSPPKKGRKKGKKHRKDRRKRGAEPSAPRDPRGFYLGLGVGLVGVEDTAETFDGIDLGLGAALGVGYRITSLFGLEANVQLATHSAHQVRDGVRSKAQSTLFSGELDAKFTFPLGSPRLEGYAFAGLGYASFSANRSDGSALLGPTVGAGIGLEYLLTPTIGLGFRAQLMNLFYEEEVRSGNNRQDRDGNAFLYNILPAMTVHF